MNQKTNQYKVTIYTEKEGVRVEVWWYQNKPNEVTGEIQKQFTWAMFEGALPWATNWLKDFFHEHFLKCDASWPISDKGKEPKRAKNNQTDLQF